MSGLCLRRLHRFHHLSRLIAIGCILSLLVACALPPRLPPGQAPQWLGRISVKVDSLLADQAPQYLSATFSLIGSPAAGSLDLFTPVGTQAVQVRWSPQWASVSNGSVTREFPDLASALEHTTGANIPIFHLFNWLQGKQDKGSEASLGWEADLTRLSEGRISAVRVKPAPRIELRVVLETDN